MRGDKLSTTKQETKGVAASPFANSSMSGDTAASAAASSSSSPFPPSALKLSVSGRLSRSFSKLGLTRMSSSSSGAGAGLSRRTLLDEGKSSSSKSLPASRAASSAIPAEVDDEGQEQASPSPAPPAPPSRRGGLLLSKNKNSKKALKTPAAFGLSPSPSTERQQQQQNIASREEEEENKESEEEEESDDDDDSVDPPLDDCLSAAAAHARSPRRGLPPLAAPPPRVGSLLFLAREAVRAPDLAQAPVPIGMNEPLSELQQRAEDLEYSELLDAAALAPPRSRERLLLVAAFAVSAYCGVHRTGKPFASLLGETFELVSARKGFRFLAEKVRHSPTSINRAHARGRAGWTFDLEDELRVRLAASSPGGIDLAPAVLVRVRFDDGDAYRWGKAITTVHGVLAGRMWLQHRGKWSVSSEATGERVELEFGCFGGAAAGEFAAALRDEAAEAAALLRRKSRSGDGNAGSSGNNDASCPSISSSSASPSSNSSKSSSSCAASFETVGFAPGAALSEREKAVAAKRRALREVRGRLVQGGCGGSGSCSSCRKSGGSSSCCPGSGATGITLAGAWDSGLVIIDDSVAEEEESEEAPPSSPSTSPPSAAAASAPSSSAPQQQRQRRRRRSIIWTAAVDATSPVARGDNRYCMSRWTLALNEEDGAAEAAATRADSAAVSLSRFGASNASSSTSSSLSLPQDCQHSRASVAFRAPPATDSRRRPDLRAVEHGNWEAASAARDALLAAQAKRAAASSAASCSSNASFASGHEPAWFRVRDPGATAGEAFMFEYSGGYWADRKRRAAEDDRERRAKAAAAKAKAANDDENDDDHLFFDAQEAPF